MRIYTYIKLSSLLSANFSLLSSKVISNSCTCFENHTFCVGGIKQYRVAYRSVFSTSVVHSKMAEHTLSKPVDKNVFRFSDYDCIGFDLDNTLCMYKLTEMVKLEYEVLARYLVSEKGYNADYLLTPLESNIDFLQKGLVLDFFRGNVLQLRYDGAILKASHGTRFLSDEEIKEIYGAEKKWETSVAFTQNMLEYWNGPLSERIRTVSDYFDMPAALAFGRIVDSLDAKEGGKLNSYDIWPDILDGLYYMFNREHFASNEGGYFNVLKQNPSNYINKCSNNVINWLKQIKSSKVTFLITGSNADFASFTASNCLGENWQSLFDIVVCYARKPGFFTGARPFIRIENFEETDPIEGKDLESGKMYSQGNWQELLQFLTRQTGLKQPKCLYIGDNLIQDVYVPSEYTKCDAVAVVEEQGAEGMEIGSYFHDDTPMISSKKWGSFFGNSFWGDIIKKHSKICIPDLEVLTNVPLNYEFVTFAQGDSISDVQGYYPACPMSLSPNKQVA